MARFRAPSRSWQRSEVRKTLIFNQKTQQHRDIAVTPEQWAKAVKGDMRMQKFICKRFRVTAECGFVEFEKLELSRKTKTKSKPQPATLF